MFRKTQPSLQFEQKVRETVGQVLTHYTSMTPEKRQELESKGVNLGHFISDNILPLVHQSMVRDVLVVMEEGIGNMVMLTPMIRSLKYAHPNIRLTVLGKYPSLHVIEGWDLVDRVITEFDGRLYDMGFLTIWSDQTIKKYGDQLNQFCKFMIKMDLKAHHESIQHMALAEIMGASGDIPDPHCELVALPVDDPKFNAVKVDKYIVFADTALRLPGGEWDVKRWPHYHELSELIRRKYPEYKVIMVGDKKDKEEANRMKWPENVDLSLMGELTIPQLAYVIKHAEFFVGNDSGPAHIAGAMGTKTYVIFAPTMVSKNRPLGPNVQVINKRFPCSPCQYTERFKTCECIKNISAQEVYEVIFHADKNIKKVKTILVGDFSGGALRNEIYIKKTLEKEFGHKVIPFEYRQYLQKMGVQDATYKLLNEVMHHEPDHVLICGGQELEHRIISYISILCPNTKVYNWYVDNRGDVEQWFHALSSVCHKSYWTTGDPIMLSKVFSQSMRPCEFLPIVPDDKSFFPIECEKDIDVLFVGTPHSQPRLSLLSHLIKEGIDVQIYGNGKWPDELKPHANPGVFGDDFNKLLNRAKIVLNTNVINTVPLYFSDRYFYPMAVQTVGLNQYVPTIEDMFKGGEEMVFFSTPQECVEKIKELLEDDKTREAIGQRAFDRYKKDFTLKNILKRIFYEQGKPK